MPIVLLVFCCFVLLSNFVYSYLSWSFLGFFNDYFVNNFSLIFNVVLWVLYIVFLFWYFSSLDDSEVLLFFLLLAGASNIVMLFSPIFGSRSNLYFYYFALILVEIVIGQLRFNKKTAVVLCILAVLFAGYRMYKISVKYRLVNGVQNDRLSKIAYYVDHPEDKDVWLKRMPIFSVHGADIEEGDDYHFETFKAYYGLSPDCVIHFYFES